MWSFWFAYKCVSRNLNVWILIQILLSHFKLAIYYSLGLDNIELDRNLFLKRCFNWKMPCEKVILGWLLAQWWNFSLFLEWSRRRLITLSRNDTLSGGYITGLGLGFAPYEKRITELLRLAHMQGGIVCSLREEITELLKVAKLTRITILTPTCRFFDAIIDVDYWYHAFTFIQDQCWFYTRNRVSRDGLCYTRGIMSSKFFGSKLHQSHSCPMQFSETQLSSRAHKCICSCDQC